MIMKEEKITLGVNSEYPLNGMLTIPSGIGGPHPAVVFVHGSGGSDMDSKVYNVRPFKDLAEGLAKHGIASIRYDKRTFTHGKKMVKSGSLTVKEETIEDAILATDILRADERIDSGKIFIAGLSMGGMLAPRIDAEGGNYAGLIIMAGTPRRLEEVMKAQLEEFLETSKGLVKWLVKMQGKKLHSKFEGIYEMSDEEAQRVKIANGATALYFKDMGKKQVSEYLAKATKPILVMQGDKDFHVCIEKDFNEYKRILANHPNTTFKLYPNLNHVFMQNVHGDIKKVKEEYSKPQHVEESVITDIAEWINSA